MKPVRSSATLISYGNATTPFIGSMAAIDHRVSNNSPIMRAPGLTGSAPRLSILEKVTPPNVNATKGIQTAQARVRTNVVRSSNRVVNAMKVYARTIAMRQRAPHPKFVSEIGTAISTTNFSNLRQR